MFDPAKVRRHDTDFPDENGRWYQATCVEAEDYDQLLELYRQLKKDFEYSIRDTTLRITE